MSPNLRELAKRNAQREKTAPVFCPECGKAGKHWVAYPMTLQDIMHGNQNAGFWTCAKFYGPDGRRIGT